MVDLPFLEIKFKRPEVAPEVANLLKKPSKPKKETLPRFWTLKERLIVGVILAVTILGSLYFWKAGGGGNLVDFNMPVFNFSGFGFNETIVVE